MDLDTTLVGDVVILKLAGELTSRKDIARAFWSHLHKGNSKFIINIEKVRAINTVGLNALLEFKRLAEAAGGSIVLCKICDEVKKMLIATRTEEMFTSFEDEDIALTGLIRGLPLVRAESSVSRHRN